MIKVFQAVPFASLFEESKVYEDKAPVAKFNTQSDAETGTHLELFGCRGETVPFALWLQNCDTEDISIELTVNVNSACTDLDTKGGGNATVPDYFDLWFVKEWEQAGVGVYQSNPIQVAELLLKDPDINLVDGYARLFKTWKHLLRKRTVYSPPDVRLTGPPRCALKPGERRRAFGLLKIPEQLSPGMREFNLVATANGDRAYVTLSLRVLPFALEQPERELLLWFRGTLDWRRTQHYVPEKIFQLQLADIFDHGFTSISLNESDFKLAQRAIDIAEDVGFDNNIVWMPPYPASHDKLKYRKTRPIFYISDEIDARISEPVWDSLREFHHANLNAAKKLGVKTMTSVLDASFIPRFCDPNDLGPAPDFVAVYLQKNKEQMLAPTPNTPGPSQIYYWHAFMEKPNLHRLLCGALLYNASVIGVSPYCYQHRPVAPFSPFDDFDQWEPNFRIGPDTRSLRDAMTTYPARNGVIPTLQFEGMRAGITDLRYLRTLEVFAERTKNIPDGQNIAAQAFAAVEKHMKRIQPSELRINSETNVEPLDSLNATDLDAFRSEIAGYVLQLFDIHRFATSLAPES